MHHISISPRNVITAMEVELVWPVVEQGLQTEALIRAWSNEMVVVFAAHAGVLGNAPCVMAEVGNRDQLSM